MCYKNNFDMTMSNFGSRIFLKFTTVSDKIIDYKREGEKNGDINIRIE